MTLNAQDNSDPAPGPGAPDPERPPLVTVAICTRNRARLMEQAVQSVLGQINDQTEILIVDNGSTDETPEAAARFAARHPSVLVRQETELGLSAARNAALAKARGAYVIFLDDDATAEEGWLEAYFQFFKAAPSARIGAAGGAVFPRFERSQPAWLEPGAHTLNWSDRTQRFTGKGGPWGCNFGLHRQTALELGGFNTALGRKGNSMGAHEETDLFQRMQRAGFELWWLPAARIRHLVPAQRLSLGFHLRVEFSHGRSSALYRLQRIPSRAARALFLLGRVLAAPFHFAVCLLAGLVVLPFRQRRAAVGLFSRSARIAGFAYQLALEAFSCEGSEFGRT